MGVDGGGPSKRHLGPDPHLRVFDPNPQVCRFYSLNLAQQEKALPRKSGSPY